MSEKATPKKESTRLNKLLKVLKKIDTSQTQKAIAEKIGVNESKISRLKNDKSKYEHNKIIKKIEAKYTHLVKWNEDQGSYTILSKEKEKPKIDIVEELIYKLEEILKKNPTNTLKIIDTWMPYTLQDRSGLIASWQKYVKKSIDILILNPKSELVAKRIKALPKYTAKKAKTEILQNIQLIKELSSSKECDVNLHLFDEFPGVNCFIMDHAIYYNSFLSYDYSTNLFFHQIENSDNLVAQNIIKHFDTIWNKRSERMDEVTKRELKKNIQESDRKRITLKKLVEKLKSKYFLYNLDEKEADKPFQVSILEIKNKEKGQCELQYQDRKNKTIHKCPGKIELVGDNNLHFSFEKESFFLELLASKVETKHELIETLYLHTDTKERPRASTCLMIDPEQYEGVKGAPSRNSNDVDIAIREYLSEDRNNILEFFSNHRKFEDIAVPKSNTFEYLRRFAGKWFLYYPEKRSNLKNWSSNHYLNSIGRGILKLRKHNHKVIFEANFSTSDGYKLKAEVKILHLNSQHYISIPLKGEGIFLHLLIKIGRKKVTPAKLNANFNIVYANGKTGGGLAVITRINENQDGQVKSLSPLNLHKELDINNIYNLSYSTNAISYHQKKEIDIANRFAGNYKIYSYGRSSVNRKETRCVTVGILKINEFGYVQIKSPLNKGTTMKSHGYCELLGNNLFFELRNNDENLKERKGYVILHVNKLKAKEGRIYCGIFSGLDYHYSRPLSKRIIFEYIHSNAEGDAFDTFTPYKTNINTETFNKLDPAITGVLLGSTHNYIGFHRGPESFDKSYLQKLIKKEEETQKVFVATAIYVAKSNQPLKDRQAEVSKWLKKGIAHGLKDLDNFKEATQSIPDYDKIMEFLKKDLQAYLNLLPPKAP